MFIPNFKENLVTEVKSSPIDRNTYVMTVKNHAGKQTNFYYSKIELEELLKKTGTSTTEELKGRTVVVNGNKIAFLPEGAKLTIAARDKDGKLIEFDFLG